MVSSCHCGNQLSIIHLQEIVPPFPLIQFPNVSAAVALAETTVERKQLNDYMDQGRFRSEIDLNVRKLKDADIQIVVQQLTVIKQCKKLRLNENNLKSSGARVRVRMTWALRRSLQFYRVAIPILSICSFHLPV